jgi:hypothetical protein
MHKSTLSLGMLFALMGCVEDDEPELSSNDAPSTVTTPPPAVDDLDELDGPQQSTQNDRWLPCTSSAQCLPNEQCIRGVTESFNVCLASCSEVDDCIDPSIPTRTDFTAFITCSELQGARRCVLGCVSTAQCIPGMSCLANACVWK